MSGRERRSITLECGRLRAVAFTWFTRKKKGGPEARREVFVAGRQPRRRLPLERWGETRRVAGGRDPATASSERPELVRHLPMFNGLSLAAKSFHAWRRRLVGAAASEARRAWRARQLEPATPDSRKRPVVAVPSKRRGTRRLRAANGYSHGLGRCPPEGAHSNPGAT